MTHSTTAQWLPDPTARYQHRYWGGECWTTHVSNNGHAAIDPAGPPDHAAAPGPAPSHGADSSPAAGRDEPWAFVKEVPAVQPDGRAIISYGRRFPEMIWDAHLHMPGIQQPEVRQSVQILSVLNDLGLDGWLLVDSAPSAIAEWHDYVMAKDMPGASWEFGSVAYGKEASMKQPGTMIWAAYIALPHATRLDVRDNVELSDVVDEMQESGWRLVLSHPAKGIEASDHYFVRPAGGA